MAEVEESILVPTTAETVFEFFRRPQLVLDISDPSIGAKLLEAPDVMSSGDRLVIELMAFGMVRKVVYEVSVDEASRSLCETMVEGDLKAWSHTKSFPVEGDGCRVVDTVQFEPPGGMAAFLLTAEKIGSHVLDGIAYRNERLPTALDGFSVG